MRGGAGDHNSLPTRLARKVGGCNDKVKWMLWGGGSRCARLFLSRHLVKLFSLRLSYTCRAQSQSRRRKHVLSLMTGSQGCPCWGKEACQGSSPTTTSDTADLCKVTEPRKSPDINLQWDKDTTLSLTSRRNKGFSVTLTPSSWVYVEDGTVAPTIIRWNGV